MGSFSCASGSSASAPREMEEAARDRCAGESSFALARASVASIWASARGRSGAGMEGTCGRQRGARRGAGRRRRLFAARRLAREIDPIKRRFVEPGGSGGRSAAARARTGEEAVLAQDLRGKEPGGLGGHASLAAERGGELADDPGAALGHQRGVVIDAQHRSCSVRGPAIGAVRLGATRAVVVTSASRGALASRCERADGSCASRSARRVAPSLLRGPAAAAILRIVRNAEPPKPSRRCFFCGSKFSREISRTRVVWTNSQHRKIIKDMGLIQRRTRTRTRLIDCIGGPS